MIAIRGLLQRTLLGAALVLFVAGATPREDLAGAQGNRPALEALTKSDDRDVAARASFHLGELDERDRKYDAALGHYRDVLRLDPGNWFAGAARARIEVLALYEGSFAELAELNAVRHDPARSNDRAAVDALEKSSTTFRDRVRAETLLFIAEAWIGRFNEPARGVEPALSVARSNTDKVLRDAGWDLAWSALRRVDLGRATREIANDPSAPPAIRERVVREVRRRTLHRASLGVATTGGLLLIGAASIAFRRGRFDVFRRTATRPLALAFLLVTPIFAGMIADAWDHGMGSHFAPFALGLFLVHLLASAWRGAFGDRGRGVRVAGGMAAALCVLAAAYLALEHGEAYGAPLLEGFGL